MPVNDERIQALRAELERTAEIVDEAEQMLEVAAIVQEAVLPLGLRPVVVGGLALAFWVPNPYLTKDIDVVMPYVPEAEGVLGDLGFKRDGRFWVLEGRGIIFEAPGSVLKPDPTDYEEVELPSGRHVTVQSPEGVLMVRMEELAGTQHPDVFEQCLFLVGSGALDDEKIGRMAEGAGLMVLLEWLRKEALRVEAGGKLPETWEIAEEVKRRL